MADGGLKPPAPTPWPGSHRSLNALKLELAVTLGELERALRYLYIGSLELDVACPSNK